jgi:hypothetical protein
MCLNQLGKRGYEDDYYSRTKLEPTNILDEDDEDDGSGVAPCIVLRARKEGRI